MFKLFVSQKYSVLTEVRICSV